MPASGLLLCPSSSNRCRQNARELLLPGVCDSIAWRIAYSKKSRLVRMKPAHCSGTSSSKKIASTGQTSAQTPQSMHSAGLMKYCSESYLRVDAVDRANFDAGRILRPNAWLGDDVCHRSRLLAPNRGAIVNRESRTGPAVNCTALVTDELADINEYTNRSQEVRVGSAAQIPKGIFWNVRSIPPLCRYDDPLEAHFATEIRHADIWSERS